MITTKPTKVTYEDVLYMAATVYGEARGESEQGKLAVAQVILNRLHKKSWYGNSIIDVCVKPWQFSCWNENDPNSKKVRALAFGGDSNPELNSDAYLDCLAAAIKAVRGGIEDKTLNSTHYHTRHVSPKWSEGKEYISIGNHQFYNNVR